MGDPFLNYFALFLLIFVVVVLFYGIIAVYDIPHKIAESRGWENTLTGVPKEIYELWAKYFRQREYKLKVEIVDFPGGMPGDVGMTLKWG